MAALVSISSINGAGQQLRVLFNIILSGNYPAGGDPISFATAVQDPAFAGMLGGVEASQAPVSLDCWDASGNIINDVHPVLGTTYVNSKVKFTASAAGPEFTPGAYSAGLLASKILGEA